MRARLLPACVVSRRCLREHTLASSPPPDDVPRVSRAGRASSSGFWSHDIDAPFFFAVITVIAVDDADGHLICRFTMLTFDD